MVNGGDDGFTITASYTTAAAHWKYETYDQIDNAIKLQTIPITKTLKKRQKNIIQWVLASVKVQLYTQIIIYFLLLLNEETHVKFDQPVFCNLYFAICIVFFFFTHI